MLSERQLFSKTVPVPSLKRKKKCFVYNFDRELASINNKAKLIPVKLLGFSGLLQSKANRRSFTTENDMGWYCE